MMAAEACSRIEEQVKGRREERREGKGQGAVQHHVYIARVARNRHWLQTLRGEPEHRARGRTPETCARVLSNVYGDRALRKLFIGKRTLLLRVRARRCGWGSVQRGEVDIKRALYGSLRVLIWERYQYRTDPALRETPSCHCSSGTARSCQARMMDTAPGHLRRRSHLLNLELQNDQESSSCRSRVTQTDSSHGIM